MKLLLGKKNALKKGKKGPGGKRQARISPGQEVVIQPEQPAQPPQPLQPGELPPKPLKKGKGKKKGGKVKALKLGKLRKAIRSNGAVLSPMQRKMRLQQQKRRAKEGFNIGGITKLTHPKVALVRKLNMKIIATLKRLVAPKRHPKYQLMTGERS